MPILATANGGDFELAPTGLVQAVCSHVEDIGTQESNFNNETKYAHKIVICWELMEKMTAGTYAGKPFMLSKRYTLSLHKKASLSADLESWFGKALTDEQRKTGIDLEKLVGKNCMLTVGQKTKSTGDEGREITAISPLMKGLPAINRSGSPAPTWISIERAKSREAKADIESQVVSGVGGASAAPGDDDLPF